MGTRENEARKVQALGNWGRIAQGEMNEGLRQWLQGVAGAVLEAGRLEDPRAAMVKAVQLDGWGSLENYAIRVLEETWSDKETPEGRRNLRFAQEMMLPKGLDPEQKRSRIRNATKKRGK